MKKIITTFLCSIVLSTSSYAATTESKLNTAISNIASAIEDISDSKDSVIRTPVNSEMSKESVEEAMESVATSIGIRSVGMLPISEMRELQTGTKQRFYKVYQYIDMVGAMTLTNYSTKLPTVFPIRINLVEDIDGKLWLTTNDLQKTIRQQKYLPKHIEDILYRAKVISSEIMKSGATGDF
jgi:uncharacterized protein (DUF302 family)